MSDMAQTLVTSVARDQILALDDDGRDAVDEVIQNLSAEHGEAIDLPGAPEGTSYLAMRGRGESTPVVIYRAVRGNWLVLSLMTQEEYEDILQLQGVLSDPAARRLVEATAKAVELSREYQGTEEPSASHN